MTFTIRRSRIDDVPCLPAIERSASDLFRTIPDLAWIADGDDMSVDRHLQFVEQGTSWVAEENDGQILAFLCAEVMDDALHIWELAVALHQQRRGIGGALMMEAINVARQRRLWSVTLTTFRAVAWNEPAYRRMGFQTLRPRSCDARLARILQHEAEGGLPIERRCAMRLALATSSDL